MDIEIHSELLAYLRDTRRIGPDQTPTFATLAGGVSNRTVLVQLSPTEGWVMKQALEKLRVKADWFSDPARIHHEALALKHLPAISLPNTITPLIFEDEKNHILAMHAVPSPHDNLKTVLLRPDLASPGLARIPGFLSALPYAAILGHILGTIHSNAHRQAATLRPLFADQKFFLTLRIEPYYTYTASRQRVSAGYINKLVADTKPRALTLVHGDFSPKNVLVHEGQLILLDHEVIHWGDPAFDIGFMSAHLLSKANHLAPRRKEFIEAAREFWASYLRATVDMPFLKDLESFAVRHTLACMLARVEGRSPLEYLTDSDRERQRFAVVNAMSKKPATIDQMIDLILSEF